MSYFNPRSPCGERLSTTVLLYEVDVISIHAPRVGSDPSRVVGSVDGGIFQSTLPVWGATRCMWWAARPWMYFNPRSPCGERHTSRLILLKSRRFQSTLPVWGATIGTVQNGKTWTISIHAPRVGSDAAREISCEKGRISIHAPRVGSDQNWGLQSGQNVLISIHAPRVGSDGCHRRRRHRRLRISIHAPRVGSDSRPLRSWTSPSIISIHAPRVGSDDEHYFPFGLGSAFQSTLPVWGATGTQIMAFQSHIFQSTLPVWGATSTSKR